MDYLSAFIEVMRARELTVAQIDRFAALWRTLPPGVARLPCPICYSAGGWGEIGAPYPEQGIEHVKCGRCKTVFPLGPAG